ncbi:TetR/AcrR family transcriptional regulator [Demequina sp.]|uniref:TetR/AcrR family transcriptional regulator n=1 Tax=Demequina sp. TaxID=2050685 RepID=UPI0025E1377D|nr:TetR/AcrR family transcriptional regulator [Demequina sp.]
MPTTTEPSTQRRILEASRELVVTHGYATLSTRKVAELAGVPLSQIHYHFGSKGQLVLATLDAENRRLVDRQAAMYASDEPFSRQWAVACDYLEADLASGYVRILQEMIAAGYSDFAIRSRVRDMITAWTDVIGEALRHHYRRGLTLGTLTVEQATALVAAIFMGAEVLLLTEQDSPEVPLISAVRAVGDLIEAAEST